MRSRLLFLLSLWSVAISVRINVYSQSCGSLNIQHRVDIPSSCSFIVMTMMHDALDRPYLYVANKEAGLRVYNISSITNPILVATIPRTLFDTLDVMSVSQYGNYLYLAIGNSFTNPQRGGMAIVDVANPLAPFVTDHYVVPASANGGGIVKVEGNYAYLGAMGSGLVILDVTNKSDIQFVSQFIPNINYPPVPNPNPNYYNARGMEVRNSIVYLCYDAGGLRIINCTNKSAPRETGRYANPALHIPFNLPRAYNNIVLDDSLAYIAVDYCGMEVLNISDTTRIRLRGWWNPYNCPNNNWFESPVHANEMYFNKSCNQMFLSTGKSDMYVLDVSDHTRPDSCNAFGGVANGTGTWGVGVYQNQIYLSYICTLGWPFPSDWTGIKILTYTPCTSAAVGDNGPRVFMHSLSQNYPNPFNPSTEIKYQTSEVSFVTLKVFDVLGREVATLVNEQVDAGQHEATWNASALPGDIYFYRVQSAAFVQTKKAVLLK